MESRLNAIRIKTGVLKRSVKERDSYLKELANEIKRLDKMKSQNKDQHDLSYQEKVIQENQMMIPNCNERIQTAYNDLKALVEETENEMKNSETPKDEATGGGDEEMMDTEPTILTEAKALLTQISATLVS